MRCNEAALPHGLVKDVVSVTRVVIETLTVLGRYTSPSVIVSERSKIPQPDYQPVKWSLLVANVGSHLTGWSDCGSRIALSDGECI